MKLKLFWGEQPGHWPIGQWPGTFFSGELHVVRAGRPRKNRRAKIVASAHSLLPSPARNQLFESQTTTGFTPVVVPNPRDKT
jgi:hypothetical protein